MTKQYQAIPAIDRQVKYTGAIWDFNTDGGALGDVHPLITSSIPTGAMILDAYIEVLVATVGSGSKMTLYAGGIELVDGIAQTYYNELGELFRAMLSGPGKKATWDTKVDRSIYFKITDAELTAGKLSITIRYLMPAEDLSE